MGEANLFTFNVQCKPIEIYEMGPIPQQRSNMGATT